MSAYTTRTQISACHFGRSDFANVTITKELAKYSKIYAAFSMQHIIQMVKNKTVEKAVERCFVFVCLLEVELTEYFQKISEIAR